LAHQNQRDSIGERLGQLSLFISEDLYLTFQALFPLIFLNTISLERMMEIINKQFEAEKRFVKSYIMTPLRERAIQSTKKRISWVIEFSSRNEIPFNSLFYSIKHNFRVDQIKELIPVQAIIQFYGYTAVSKFKKHVNL